MGFTFDEVAAAKGVSESLETMRALTANDLRNAERIFPYIGGEEVKTSSTHAHHRYVIDFADFQLRREAMAKDWAAMTAREREEALRNGIVPSDYPWPVAADWPDLIDNGSACSPDKSPGLRIVITGGILRNEGVAFTTPSRRWSGY
jgi:hypothetical protein